MSDFTLKRGLTNVFAVEIKDTADGYEMVGTPFHLIPAGEMSRSASNETTPIFLDNTVFFQSGTESATEISITGAALRPADIARLNAKYIDAATGAVLDTGEYTEKYFAVGGETQNIDGTQELFWFLKGTFSIPEQADKTKDNSTDTNGMTLNYSAIQTKKLFAVGTEMKPMKKVVIDTKTTKLKDKKSWTEQVVTPENLAEIVEKVAAA